jgi:hypothetical protein
MALESATYIDDLVITNPTGGDQRTTADDHMRLLKSVLKNTFPNADGAINPTVAQFNYLVGVTSAIQTQINAKQATITGAATTVTGSNLTINRALISNASGKIAVHSTVSDTELGYINGVTSAIQTQLNAKAPLASPALTGNPTATTQATANNSTRIATTAFCRAAIAAYGVDADDITHAEIDWTSTSGGTWAISASGSQVIPEGLYAVSCITGGGGTSRVQLQVYQGGAWRTATANLDWNFNGTVYSDGTNMRLAETGGSAGGTAYYRRLA